MTFPVGQEERIRALEAQVQHLSALVGNLSRSVGLQPSNSEQPEAVASGPERDPVLQGLLARGSAIEATKRYRALTGMGLREAKAAIDQMLR